MSLTVHLELVYRGPSAGVLERVEGLARRVEGFVTEARWFSNLALSVAVDATVGGLSRLPEALESEALRASVQDLAAVAGALSGRAEDDALLRLLVRCVHDEPEVRRAVPQVPG